MCTRIRECSFNDWIYFIRAKITTRKPGTFKTKQNLPRVGLGEVGGGETSGRIVRENTDISMIKNKKQNLKTHKTSLTDKYLR